MKAADGVECAAAAVAESTGSAGKTGCCPCEVTQTNQSDLKQDIKTLPAL